MQPSVFARAEGEIPLGQTNLGGCGFGAAAIMIITKRVDRPSGPRNALPGTLPGLGAKPKAQGKLAPWESALKERDSREILARNVRR